MLYHLRLRPAPHAPKLMAWSQYSGGGINWRYRHDFGRTVARREKRRARNRIAARSRQRNRKH